MATHIPRKARASFYLSEVRVTLSSVLVAHPLGQPRPLLGLGGRVEDGRGPVPGPACCVRAYRVVLDSPAASTDPAMTPAARGASRVGEPSAAVWAAADSDGYDGGVTL